MVKVFISYRRDDSQYVTDSIYSQMKHEFGEDNVFLDVGDIPFGVDFRDYLHDQIKARDVILVIIGKDWARIMQERAQSVDYVRIEIENALALNKLIIPILVKDASMPDFDQLPAGIADLQYKNAAKVRRIPDLEIDCKRIADNVKDYLGNLSKSADPIKEETPHHEPKAIEENQPHPEYNDPEPIIKEPPPQMVHQNLDVLEAIKSILPEPFDIVDIPEGNFLYGEKQYKDILASIFHR